MKKIITQQWIAPLIGTALFLGACHLINLMLGWPSWCLRLLFDLDREISIAAWFSSALWLLGALTAFQCAQSENVSRKTAKNWNLIALGLALFSMDETVGLHENLGLSIYKFFQPYFPQVEIRHTIWPFTLLPFVLVLLAVSIRRIKDNFSKNSRIMTQAFAGLFLVFGAAFVLDITTAFLNHQNLDWIWQAEILAEEVIEMLGAIVFLGALVRQRDEMAVQSSEPVLAGAL